MTSAGQGETLESARPQYAAGLTARTEEHAYRFLQHFIWISFAMDRPGEHHDEMWDEEDRLLRRSDRPFARKEHP